MKRAYVIGLNSYTKQKPLRGAVNDAALIADLLRYRFNFEFVDTALDKLSKGEFFTALSELLSVSSTEGGDRVRVLYFAGHGASVIDDSQDELDQIDEVLCLPDYSWDNRNSFIRDDEIAGAIDVATTAHPELRITCVFDCCHSGTGTRGIGSSWLELLQRHQSDLGGAPLSLTDPRLALYSAIREADSQPLQPGTTYSTRRIGLAGSSDQEQMNHLLISACSDAQKAKEAEIGGTPHGVFTMALAQSIGNNPQLTYGGLHAAIAANLSAMLDQTPQIEGPASLKGSPLFN